MGGSGIEIVPDEESGESGTPSRYIVNSNIDTSNLVTDEELESGLAGKQDALTQTQLDTLSTAYTSTNLVFNRNLVLEDIYSDDTILLASLIDNNNVSFVNATLLENTGTIDNTYTHFNSNSYQFNSYNSTPYGTTIKYLTYGLGKKLNGIDFTIDFWYYIRNVNQSQTNTVINLKSGDTSFLQLKANGFLYLNGEYDSGTTAISKTTWNHYALTYSNTTGVIKTYINGLLAGTSTSSVPNLLSGDINFSAYCTTYAVGAMQGLRIRKGVRSNNDNTFTVPTDFATTTLTANKSLNADVDLSNYATTSALTTGLASKQNALTATQLNNINNAYTSENLTAGSGIEFAEVSGGIDANTLNLYHLDTDLEDTITGFNTVTTLGRIVTDTYKFDNGSLYGNNNESETGNVIPFSFSTSGAQYTWTLDFWYRSDTYNFLGQSSTGMALTSSGTNLFKLDGNGNGFIGYWAGSWTAQEFQALFPLNTWNHIAVVNDNGYNQYVFINGQLLKHFVNESQIGWSSQYPYLKNFFTAGTNQWIDEVRFSNVARWTASFTPATSAYNANTTTQVKTDNTVVKTSDLSGYLPLTGGTVTGKVTVQTGSGIEFKDTAGNTRGHIRADDVFYIQSEDNNIYMQGSGTFANVQIKQNGWQTVQTTFNKGVANGIASLDANAKVPATQLPLDTALDTTSDNPVKNSVIANTVNTINTAIQQVADVTKRGIYELSTVITPVSGTATVVLQDDISIYAITPTASTTIVFDKTHLTVPSNAFTTFYLVLNFTSGTQTITFPNNVQWGNISPTGTANVCYMYSFMQPYGTDIWIGNEMMSWQQNAIVYEEESGSGV